MSLIGIDCGSTMVKAALFDNFGTEIAVATGLYPSYEETCKNMVKIDRRYEPNPALAGVYEQKYNRYKKLLEVFLPAWKELAQR